jgi:acetyl esterase
VVKWVGENARQIGGDPDYIGVGGGCTGGSFAAVLALMARDAGAPKIAAQYLAATVFDCRADYRSQYENGAGYTLSRDDGCFVIDVYLKDPENRWDWRASPILAPSVRGVAPAYIYVGEWDILRDESRAYADRLRDAGVEVTLVVMQQESHAVGPGNAARVKEEMQAFLRSRLTPSQSKRA